MASGAGAAAGTLVCDGNRSCVRGAFVRVAAEYGDWDVFKKFKGKVGVLNWRHFSGMWYADFPGEDEYGFLCGPLLFQLQYSSEAEVHESKAALERQRKEQELQNARETEQSKQLVQALEKRAREMSSTAAKLFEQMEIIQEEMRKTERDMTRMEEAFTNLTVHANSLDAELGSARAELGDMQQENARLQTQLRDSEANTERMAAHVMALKEEVAKCQSEMADVDRQNALLSKELHESKNKSEVLELENGVLKDKVAAVEADLAQCRTHLSAMEENFLTARREASNKPVEVDASGKPIEYVNAGNAFSTAERDSLLHQILQLQKDLEYVTKLRDESQKKFDNVMNDDDLFMRLASARHGSVGSGPAKDMGGSAMMMMTDEELHQLQLDADRAAQAERDLEEMQKKMKEMAEDAKNGKRVPGLLKDIEKLNEKIEQQKETGERHKQDLARLNAELRNLRNALKVMGSEKEQVEADLSTRTHDCHRLELECDQLKGLIAGLELKLSDMTEAMTTQRARADAVQEDAHRLASEKSRLMDQLAERDQSIVHLEKVSEGLRRETVSLTQRKAELEKQLQVARGKVREVEMREKNLQSEIDLKMRKSEARIEDLQEQLQSLGIVKTQLLELQEKHKQDAEEAHAIIQELTTARDELTHQLEHAVKKAGAERKIVQLYFHRIEHKVSVPPRKVLFVAWRLYTVATQYWNAEDTKKAQEAAVRKSKNEANSLRLRLGAAQRLVEEMQRRDKSNSVALHLIAPASSYQDVVGGDNTPATAHEETATPGCDAAQEVDQANQMPTGQVLAHKNESPAPDGQPAADGSKLKTCPKCLMHAVQLEGVNQRNTRLQREAQNFQQRLQTADQNNENLNAQISELKKSLNILGCLRHAGKLVPVVKDRKVALEARSLSQSLTVSLFDKERSLHAATGTGAHANVTLSPIVARKLELEAEAMQHGTTPAQHAEAFRSNKYRDVMEVAHSAGSDQMSIFEQLDLLTGNVSELVARHDGQHMRRQRKMQQAILENQGLQKNALKSSNSVLPPAQKPLPRPQTAH